MAKKSTAKKLNASDKFDLGIHSQYTLTMADDQPEVLENQFIGVKNNLITYVGPYKEIFKRNSRKFIHGGHHLAMPGLINAHTHLAMTLFRGVEDDVPLQTWLFERIFPLEGQFVSADFVKVGTELAALECIQFGTTTVNEMYFFAETAAKVWEQAGLRGIFSQAFIGFPLPDEAAYGVDKFELFARLHKRFQNHDRIIPGLAPHAPYTCDDELLTKVLELSKSSNSPIHIHVAEAANEVTDSLAKHKRTPVQKLMDLQFLSKNVRCAHMVQVNDEDIALVQKSGAAIIFNPDSNMKLASGAAPIPKYLKAGVPVAIGTDGSASKNDLSLFAAMNVGAKMQKLINKDPTALTAEQALYMATLGGAKALGLDHLVGSLEVSKRADVILVDLNYPHFYPHHDLISNLVYAASGMEVSDVICDGKILKHKGKITALNAEPIYKKATAYGRKIQQTLRKLREGKT